MNKEEICNKLGIPIVNDKSQLKVEWRKLVLKYHPDRNKSPDAEKNFIIIQKLFELLAKSFDAPVPQFIRINVTSRPHYYYSNTADAGATMGGFTFRWSYT